jgi:nucleoid DNA-binding protein
MNELIDKLVAEAGLTPEQAQKSLEVVVEFVKEKFPMLGGAVDNIFGGN